ncbi:MAG: hypothetical protein M8467_10705 [Anaerolineae bacterium]|nr:hypothetical protein [Anaerolineae bacterium]
MSGQPLALTAIDSVRRAELPAEDYAALLRYAGQDWAALWAAGVPFCGDKVPQGDPAFVVWPLPRLPITLDLGRGEGDLPGGGTLPYG